ncbi:hypothetical protein [Streptomyces sp. HGB0020]|uniref:hypothetical protein n=1 Tax=Streptomyces sp. HGB0020 TaxID=1078086 RepID=UPI00034EAD14|nr:hypothetical protein [Streptomyces sp. HGB0020]EPD60991.1 hypothetical protein HMPREF1211_05009 [Streptomyces sp. HGB0020]
MEQRIGSSSQPLKGEPVTGAGFDPAFIPGLTPPVSEQPEEGAAQDAEAVSEEADGASGTAQDSAAPESDEGAGEPEAAADDEEEAPEGPVFEAADRRAKIVADHRGVRLALDDQECEFRWDEIGAVETESPRFGKRFTITVHTPDRRWYPIEIEATSRSRFAEWESELDAVLDAYFEDGAEVEEDQDGAEDVEGAEDDEGAEDVENVEDTVAESAEAENKSTD